MLIRYATSDNASPTTIRLIISMPYATIISPPSHFRHAADYAIDAARYFDATPQLFFFIFSIFRFFFRFDFAIFFSLLAAADFRC